MSQVQDIKIRANYRDRERLLIVMPLFDSVVTYWFLMLCKIEE